MPTLPALSVRALGAFQLARSGAPAPKFKYLDARELLVYLLFDPAASDKAYSDTPGKSKQEIGAALWGDLSDAQLNARFKARLNDVRRVLGDRAWVVYENEAYRFDSARGVFFDVSAFTQACSEAETRRRAGNTAAEYTAWQDALSLYRGDFLQDYSTRRKPELFGEREWYLVVREQLELEYRRALERLTQLELERANPDAAIDLLRKRVTLDEYDDRAHQQLMFELALRGKRSQALRHYHNLVKHRADTPPDGELAALFEKIKRNEPLGDRTSTDSNFAPHSFADATKLAPPFQVPADLPRFVGRSAQFETLRNEILRASNDPQSQDPAPPLCLVGMGGIGKTSLAIHAAYRLRAQFPDGVLWGNLRESEPLAILAGWERAYGCDFSSLPDLNARAASLRSLLHDKRVLVLLDDVVDAADARTLLLNGAHTRTIFTSRSVEIAAALDAFLIEMPVLEANESADLLTRIVGQARVAGQETFAQAICELLGHLPLALDITAHRLVSRPHWTLREMAERLRAQMRRLDELRLADRAVRAIFALSWDALNDAQQSVLAHVGIFEARSFTAPALAFVDEREETEMRDLLDSLVALSLLSFESSARYRQHPLLADFSLEKLENRRQTSDVRMQRGDINNQQSAITNQQSSAHARLSQFYLQFATENRRHYLALEEEWDNLNVGIEIAHAQSLWQSVIDYGDVLTDAWFARGRFTDARHNYPYVMRAARDLEEQDPYIAAALNWGKACIDQGDYAEAEEHLQHGLQTSREVNDEYGIGTALFLLARVSVERSEYDAAQKYLEESQGIRERIGDRAGVAETLYMQGRTNFFLGNLEHAVQLANNAVQIHETLAPDHSYIVSLRWAGRINAWQKNYVLAEGYIRKALAQANESSDLGEYATALYDLANTLWRMHEFSRCYEFAIKSLPLLVQIGDRKTQSHVLELLSMAAMDLQDYPDAIERAKAAFALVQEIGDQRSMLRNLLRLGDAYEKLNLIDHACKTRSEVLPLARQFQHPRTSTLEEWLAQFCSKV